MSTTKKSISSLAYCPKFSDNICPIDQKMFTSATARKFIADLVKCTKQSMYKNRHKLHQKHGNE